jgi:glutamate N-acetyltransferase / amino-acid N-acetyltransferase
MIKKIINKTITDIKGVYATGIHCGLKFKKKDLAFIYVPEAAASAGVFTRNKFCASCVTFTKKVLKKNVLKAVIMNSGNANAGTGELGTKNTKHMAKITADMLGINASEVGVASTGIIGKQLPMDVLEAGIKKVLANPYVVDGSAAAEAILTTDTCLKQAFFETKIDGKRVVVAGISKGSGMLAPNMATTLTYLVTNANLEQKFLQAALADAINDTYNMTSVDTDTSTNDMALLISTKEDGVVIKTNKDKDVFLALLTEACTDLCKMIATDGEGATKLIEVNVVGAANGTDARKIAMNVVDSPLVKTAIHGEDPNWGRVIAAAGKSPEVKLNPDKFDLYFGDVQILAKGMPVAYDDFALKEQLKNNKVFITLELNLGSATAKAWGCDLTKGYIDINTKYN